MDDIANIVRTKLGQNASYRADLLALIASGEAIGFVGAGLSVPLNYPSWPGLLDELEARAQGLGPFTMPPEVRGNFLRRADAIKEHFHAHSAGPVFDELIGRRFEHRTAGPNCTETHKLLAGLPFRAFATTNYESCMESALQSVAEEACPDPGIIIKMDGRDRHRVSLFLRSLADGGLGPRYVAHLHGRLEDTANIVLTEKDYVRAYGFAQLAAPGSGVQEVTLHRHLTWSLFATRRIVFVGFSMKDPYIKALLDAVARDLWEVSEKNHFIVLALEPNEVASADSVAADFEQKGIRVVFYDNMDGRHTGLDQLLSEAGERCAIRIQPVTTVATPTATAASPPTQSTGISSSAAWLDEVSERNAPTTPQS